MLIDSRIAGGAVDTRAALFFWQAPLALYGITGLSWYGRFIRWVSLTWFKRTRRFIRSLSKTIPHSIVLSCVVTNTVLLTLDLPLFLVII